MWEHAVGIKIKMVSFQWTYQVVKRSLNDFFIDFESSKFLCPKKIHKHGENCLVISLHSQISLVLTMRYTYNDTIIKITQATYYHGID